MIKKVKISRVFKNTENKDGVPYTIKNGKDVGATFTRVGIRTEQTGDEVYSNNARADSPILNIEVGQELTLKLYEDNGFKNFKFPTKDETEAYNQALADALSSL